MKGEKSERFTQLTKSIRSFFSRMVRMPSVWKVPSSTFWGIVVRDAGLEPHILGSNHIYQLYNITRYLTSLNLSVYLWKMQIITELPSWTAMKVT